MFSPPNCCLTDNYGSSMPSTPVKYAVYLRDAVILRPSLSSPSCIFQLCACFVRGRPEQKAFHGEDTSSSSSVPLPLPYPDQHLRRSHQVYPSWRTFPSPKLGCSQEFSVPSFSVGPNGLVIIASFAWFSHVVCACPGHIRGRVATVHGSCMHLGSRRRNILR